MYTKASAIRNHRLYPEFVKVSQRLAEHQFVCWLAGGAVRDLLMDREVSDFDLVTDASTEVLKALFPDAVLVGEAFGVLKIPVGGGEHFDLATFREEADYKDGRRPSQVRSSTPVKDSLRRDFTVNSLFWDDRAGCVRDFQGGLFELQVQQLKCVGNPYTRFGEDYLRIVRLMRFSLQLGFAIDPETLAAARAGLQNVDRVSGERIWAELKKIESHKAWRAAWSSVFFREVMAFVFQDKSLLQVKDLPASSAAGKMSLELALFLLNPATDYSSVLKSRLKISNKEFEAYRNIRFLASEAGSWKIEELTYELERSEDLLTAYQELVFAGIFSQETLREVESLRAEHPAVLVSGAEMKDLVPPREISVELRKIRVGQLGKIFRTKDDAISYLKKKYA